MNDATAKKKRRIDKRKKYIKKRRDAGKKNLVKQWKRFGILLGVILMAAATVITILLISGQGGEDPIEKTKLPIEQEKEEIPKDNTGMGWDAANHIIAAGNAVKNAYKSRPKSHELTAGNTSRFAEVEACAINKETGKLNVSVKGDGIPMSDDKYYYLFALNTYDEEIAEKDEYISREYKDNSTEFNVSLNFNLSSSRLYKKFAAAVKKDGKYVLVSAPKYITNPEAIARHASVFQEPASKKGLLIDPNKLRGSELDDLGVKQAAYNIPVARLLGPTSSSAYPTISYTYNGKTYTLNGQVVAEYDLVFSTLTAKGITTTAIILNNYSPSYQKLIHPKARSGSTAPYYMFNGAEESGVEYMAAIGSFLAERYSDNKHGKVANWIIANEINARKEWNYMEHTDIDTYVEEFAKPFRVFYTAIKSMSGSARVYISLDQQWDRNLKNNTNYDARDILDKFNENIQSKGDIDWGLAQHPYNVPLTTCYIWKSSKYVKHTASTPMMTMNNIEVLTDYMNQKQFLNEKGEVRSILLSELGYSSREGEDVQAAAFAYAYYKIEANKDIDGLLLNRQTDAPEEIAQGLAFGLNNTGGGRKHLYEVFKYIDTPDHAAHTDFAKKIIGISSWSEIMR